jgi:hypothetical protein
MIEEPRCCGTGTCIINEDGLCWCGQKWNGVEMCFSKADTPNSEPAQTAVDTKNIKRQAAGSGENFASKPTPGNS